MLTNVDSAELLKDRAYPNVSIKGKVNMLGLPFTMPAHTCKACGKSYRHASSLSRHNVVCHAETDAGDSICEIQGSTYSKDNKILNEALSDGYTSESDKDGEMQENKSDSSSDEEEEYAEEWHWHLASMALERHLVCHNTKFRRRVEQLVRDGADLNDSIDSCSELMSSKVFHDRRNFMAFFLCAIENCTDDDRFIEVMNEKDKRCRANNELDDFEVYSELVEKHDLADWLL